MILLPNQIVLINHNVMQRKIFRWLSLVRLCFLSTYLLSSVFVWAQQTHSSPSPHVFQQLPPSQQSASIGTGFFVANGYMLTALHVVINSELILIGPTEDKKWIKAEIIKTDIASDLALLSVNMTAPPLPLANWRDVPIGLEVFAIGYPQPRIQNPSKKITQGIINGNRTDRNESINAEYFQYSAETSVGNSGGPLIAPDGLVIGMVQSKLNALGAAQKTNDLAINVSYALKSSKLIDFLDKTPASVTASSLSLSSQLRPYQILSKTQGSIFAVLSRKNAPLSATP